MHSSTDVIKRISAFIVAVASSFALLAFAPPELDANIRYLLKYPFIGVMYWVINIALDLKEMNDKLTIRQEIRIKTLKKKKRKKEKDFFDEEL